MAPTKYVLREDPDGVPRWMARGRTETVAIDRESLPNDGSWHPHENPQNIGLMPGVTAADLDKVGSATSPQNLTVTANLAKIEGLEIFGSLILNAKEQPEVTNCIIHGTLTRGSDTGAIVAQGDNARDAYMHDLVIAQRPGNNNEWCSIIRGGRYTMARADIYGFPDGFALTSQLGGVNIYSNWIHDGWYNEWTQAEGSSSQGGNNFYPYAGGFYTHVDGVQFHRGKNYRILNNSIGGTRTVYWDHHTGHKTDIQTLNHDMYNAALMIKQEVDASQANKIEFVDIMYNFLMGGAATVNMTYGNNNMFESVNLMHNLFDRTGGYTALRGRNGTTDVGNWADNLYFDTLTPITITRG